MAMPATKPFSKEKVITLVITGARAGKRKPLRPSSRPSVPPTTKPRMGFDKLTWRSGADARSKGASLRVRVRLHDAEEIAFGVFEEGEVADGGDRCFGHDQLSAGALYGFDGFVDGVDADGVGGRGYRRILS